MWHTGSDTRAGAIINTKKTNNMKAFNFAKELLIATFQILLMIAFYPVLIFAVIMRKRKYTFDSVSKFWIFYIFPVCGKWYLPTFYF